MHSTHFQLFVYFLPNSSRAALHSSLSIYQLNPLLPFCTLAILGRRPKTSSSQRLEQTPGWEVLSLMNSVGEFCITNILCRTGVQSDYDRTDNDGYSDLQQQVSRPPFSRTNDGVAFSPSCHCCYQPSWKKKKKKKKRAFCREEPLRALDIDGSSLVLLCIINPGQHSYST